MTQHRWQLRILGGFALLQDGEVVANFGVRREEMVLAYLAVDPTTPKLRTEMAADLWPELDSTTGRKNLTYNIFMLKKRLAELGLDDALEDTGHQRLQLHPSIEVDAQVFGEALAGATADDPVGSLEKALALYGSGLLPLYDAPWVVPHQAKFEQLYDLAVARLFEALQPTKAQESLLRELPPTAWRGTQAPPDTGSDRGLPRDYPQHELEELIRGAEEGLESADADDWQARLRAAYPAIEALFERAVRTDQSRRALDLASRMWRYWVLERQVNTGWVWMEKLIDNGQHGLLEVRARACFALGSLVSFDGDQAKALEQLQLAQELWKKRGDADVQLLRTFLAIGRAQQLSNRKTEAAKNYDQAIVMAEVLGRPRLQIRALHNRALLAMEDKKYEQARELWQRHRRLLGTDDFAELGANLANEASTHLGTGDLQQAAACARRAVQALEKTGDPKRLALVHQVLGKIDGKKGQYSQAAKHYSLADDYAREAKDFRLAAKNMAQKALTLRPGGEQWEAERIFAEAQVLLERIGDTDELKRVTAAWEEGAEGPLS